MEPLHTVLLGHDKYVWHMTHSEWAPGQLDSFASWLQSVNVDGLSIMPIRGSYMTKYRNNLIGKHFKVLQQVGIFALNAELCPPLVYDLWKATGELGAMLWYHEIESMEDIDDFKNYLKNPWHICIHTSSYFFNVSITQKLDLGQL